MSSNHVVGVDFGSSSIRAVEVSDVGSKKPSVSRFYTIPLPEGAVKNGEVLEINTVAAALRQLWSTARFSSKRVVLGVGNAKVLVRDLSVPKLSQREMRESLPTYVQEMLPVPVVDALLDFYPISESTTEAGPIVSGLLVAAIKDSVLTNVNAVQLAGLTPVGVDLIPFALTRLTSAARMVGNVAHIDIGARTTNVIVTVGGVPHFVRIIANGAEEVTQAISDRLDIPIQNAENIKRAVGYSGVHATAEQAEAVAIIREVTGNLLSGLRNTLGYFANSRQNEPYAGIVLTGGGAQLTGLADALSEVTRIPVVVGDTFGSMNVAKDAAKGTQSQLEFNVALGLALGGAAA